MPYRATMRNRIDFERLRSGRLQGIKSNEATKEKVRDPNWAGPKAERSPFGACCSFACKVINDEVINGDQSIKLRQKLKRQKKSRGRAPSESRPNTREKIKAVATKLLITQGVRGFSYADIAERLDITTTNIHHHFGNKERLVDEVVQEYVADASNRQKKSGQIARLH